jgi:hypothetical protein
MASGSRLSFGERIQLVGAVIALALPNAFPDLVKNLFINRLIIFCAFIWLIHILWPHVSAVDRLYTFAGIALVGSVWLAVYVANSAATASSDNNGGSAPVVADNRNPNAPLNPATVTLEDLFFRDFSTTGATAIFGGKTIHSPTLGDVHIRTCSSVDFIHNTVTVSVYIPFWNDTANLSKEMLRLVDARQVAKEDLTGIKVEGRQPGDSTTQTSEGLVFSGIEYIYHEKEISAEDLGDLTRLYSDNGLKVQFRSQSYLEVAKLKAQNNK